MSFLILFKKYLLTLSCWLLVFCLMVDTVKGQTPDPNKVGVLFIHHGGMDTNRPQYMWDAAVTMFTYDPHHPVYQLVIWNPAFWPSVMDSQVTAFARSFMMKYDFSYERIGGVDHAQSYADTQLADMKAVLDTNPYGLTFEEDWASYLVGDYPENYIWPRFIYHGPDGPGVGVDVTYCGEGDKDNVILEFDSGTEAFTAGATLTGQTSGATATIDEVTVSSGSFAGGDAAGVLSLSDTSAPRVKFQDGEEIVDDGTVPGSASAVGATRWSDCDPERFNVDGPLERLLKKGVSRIIVIDLTMSGIRFSKTFWPLEIGQEFLHQWNADHGTSIPLLWVNDYSNLMERSYPVEPEGWTRFLGYPAQDSDVLLEGGPNPLAEDQEIAELHVEGIESALSATVSDADTGVVLMNHALYDHTETYDPKINDTITANENIEALLLARHPEMDPENIVGAFGGAKEVNAESGLFEFTREQRGDRFGTAYLYQEEKHLPKNKWGYRYWEALEYLKNRGVQHIAVGFPQVCISSVLDLIEIPNQFGKEIGIKNWVKWGTGDYDKYPDLGHPFADYWGVWVYTDCGEWELNYESGTSDFTMGATLTGATSGATGVIKWFSGDTASGTLTLKEVSGTFHNGETITDDEGGSASANGTEIMTSEPECCFTMGGCGDPLRPYPPPRLVPMDVPRDEFDPSLTYDLCDYGHLGYDPALGSPDPNGPVQDQYTGTWDMYEPPNDDPRMGAILAKHVLNAAVNPMVYITNGNMRGIDLGETVTFEAHVVSNTGTPPVNTYEWSRNKDDSGWSVVTGETGSTWAWIPGSGEEGMYDIKCTVTDSSVPARTGEVVWEDFAVPDPDNDGYPDSEDNCPAVQNLYQEDTYPPDGNGIGDACDCEGNFDCDPDCDGSDAATFKIDFGRNEFFGECTSLEPCNGDFDCDGDCDGTDAANFKTDFGRSEFSNPCPTCVQGDWCSY